MIKYKIKPHIICDKNSKSLGFKKRIEKIFAFTSTSLKKSNLIIVIGGDGFMLHSLKKKFKYNKPFYGINSGSYGFLMNKFNHTNLYKNIYSAKQIEINPLKMKVKNKNDKIVESIAINEVSILRQSKQAASIIIKDKKKNYN